MARQVKWMILVAIVFLSGLCAVSPMARAQDDHPAHSKKAAAQKGGGMMCPMMAYLGDIKVFADSPAMLLAKTEELSLTDQQKQKLHEIEETARKQAREVLTADQREKLKDAPEGPMSMMQVCMMRHKAMMMDGKQGQMCPMCMKMMHGKMIMHQKMQHGKKGATD